MTDLSRFSNSPLTPPRPASRPRSSVRSATFLQRRRHVAGGDPQGEALDDGRLADARLAGEDRVVLPAAGEDVDDLADLGVAAEDRVDLARLGPLGQVDGELVERRRLARRPGGRRRLAGGARPAGGGGGPRPRSSRRRSSAGPCQSAPTEILASSRRGVARQARRASRRPGAPAGACPERTCVAWYSTEASTQASRIRSVDRGRERRACGRCRS